MRPPVGAALVRPGRSPNCRRRSRQETERLMKHAPRLAKRSAGRSSQAPSSPPGGFLVPTLRPWVRATCVASGVCPSSVSGSGPPTATSSTSTGSGRLAANRLTHRSSWSCTGSRAAPARGMRSSCTASWADTTWQRSDSTSARAPGSSTVRCGSTTRGKPETSASCSASSATAFPGEPWPRPASPSEATCW